MGLSPAFRGAEEKQKAGVSPVGTDPNGNCTSLVQLV